MLYLKNMRFLTFYTIWKNRASKFLDNPKAIFPFLRKKVYYNHIADSYIHHYKDVSFLSYQETLDDIILNNKSIVRFGDELFDMLLGIGLYYNNWRQQYDKSLADALKRVLRSKNPRLLICFNPEFILQTKEEFKKQGIADQYEFWTHSKIFLKDYLHKDQVYGSALCFTPRYNTKLNFQQLKEYFLTKDIVIVTSNTHRFKNISLGKNTFFIEAPESDAWQSYHRIKQDVFTCVEQHSLTKKDTLFLISMGSAAKVLTYELTDSGYTAWDTGQFFDLAYTEIKKLG